MIEMNNIDEYSDKEWEEIAAHLSEENDQETDLLRQFMADDDLNTNAHWQELKNKDSDNKIDVDKAWNRVFTLLNIDGTDPKAKQDGSGFIWSTILRIAAVVLILFTVGSTILYLSNSGYLSKKITVATTNDQKNLQFDLPDGSKIFLNRNTEISYRANFGKHKREAKLAGEAFFEISANASMPFYVDAGNANVKVLGTSFNVITRNADSAVEVYVKTGKVLLSDLSGSKELILEPEYIGTMDVNTSGKTVNKNPNYMAWNTGLLDYKGQKLDVVFKDLERVYNMIIIADDNEILDYPWTWSARIDNQSQDTIIRLICLSFTLSYTKDGNVYHLVKK
jgi:transmembrane sensor